MIQVMYKTWTFSQDSLNKQAFDVLILFHTTLEIHFEKRMLLLLFLLLLLLLLFFKYNQCIEFQPQPWTSSTVYKCFPSTFVNGAGALSYMVKCSRPNSIENNRSGQQFRSVIIIFRSVIIIFIHNLKGKFGSLLYECW